MPKVSVILSSYNHEKYIAASIESVLNQTFTDFELLIFDDGSTDDSQKIICSYKDKRIKLFLHEKNIGPIQCYLECAKNSAGKYVALQHSDDIWENTKLEKQVDFLEKNPQYEVCFTQVKFIDENGAAYDLPENHPYKNVFKQENRTRAEWINFLFWKSNCFCHPSMLIRNAPKNFAMDSAFFQLPDYCRWINLFLRKAPYILQEELISFRLRRQNQNSVSSTSFNKEIRIANEIYFLAKLFLPLLRDEKFFLKVFPEAAEFLISGKISVEFAFAQLCLKRNLPAFQKLAIEILYDLIHNDSKRKLIKKLYGYDEKNFIRDTGKFDAFGIGAKLPHLNCKLYLDYGAGFNENDTVKNPALILPEEKFSATFDFHANKEIQRLRFDPDDKAALSIKIFKIEINGEVVEDFTANYFQIVDGYFNFLTVDPAFTIDKKFSAGEIHVEIFGAVKNDALTNFEKKYSETCATLQEKNSQVQQLENSLQEKVSQVQQLENSLQEKVSQVQQLENSLQEKVSQVQQLENSLQEKVSQVQQLENSLQEKNSQMQQLENSLQEKNSQVQQLENSIAAQMQELNSKTQEINSQAAIINELQKLQQEILNSNSWKITKPLRALGNILKKI